ncbi:hypothetical protein [Nocardia sp. NPDC047654]|uniref:hypothetical protein n=1 Tax=Nocardia sp. NPDC047654 TaxID=3364314 RepID=UPI00370FE679
MARVTAVMALVRIEYATQVDTLDKDGGSRSGWQRQLFDRLPTGHGWRLLPAELHNGRWVIARGNLAAGGLQALLPRSVSTQVPAAPLVVAVHDVVPHTGRRWPW